MATWIFRFNTRYHNEVEHQSRTWEDQVSYCRICTVGSTVRPLAKSSETSNLEPTLHKQPVTDKYTKFTFETLLISEVEPIFAWTLIAHLTKPAIQVSGGLTSFETCQPHGSHFSRQQPASFPAQPDQSSSQDVSKSNKAAMRPSSRHCQTMLVPTINASVVDEVQLQARARRPDVV